MKLSTTLENKISLAEIEIRSLYELLEQTLDKTEIKNIKASIKSKESNLKKDIKLLEKEKKLEREEKLLSVKAFFNYIFSNCSFDSVMKDYTDLFEDKNEAEFVIYPINNELIIKPINEDDLFMKTVIRIKMNSNAETEFSSWIIENNKPVKFTFGDFALFRKIVLNPGKSGVKLIVNEVEITEDKFISSGAFYTEGTQDIEWEHSFDCIKYKLNKCFIEDFDDEIEFDTNSDLRYSKNNETIIEMSEDMINVWQKTVSTSYHVKALDPDENGFAEVILCSINEDATFYIYQTMNVIRF